MTRGCRSRCPVCHAHGLNQTPVFLAAPHGPPAAHPPCLGNALKSKGVVWSQVLQQEAVRMTWVCRSRPSTPRAWPNSSPEISGCFTLSNCQAPPISAPFLVCRRTDRLCKDADLWSSTSTQLSKRGTHPPATPPARTLSWRRQHRATRGVSSTLRTCTDRPRRAAREAEENHCAGRAL